MTLIINRSKKINSLNLGMFVIITKYMNQADKDDNIKIIMLKGKINNIIIKARVKISAVVMISE